MSELHYDKHETTIIIPNGTKSIPDEYFIDNDKLEEIIIPDSVEYIGRGAFKGCKSLKKVQLPNSLKVLEQFAFSECDSLEEINIPSSLHYYSCGVFSHCHDLKTINSHNEINYIDDLAFYNCKNLENFNIPSNTSSTQLISSGSRMIMSLYTHLLSSKIHARMSISMQLFRVYRLTLLFQVI